MIAEAFTPAWLRAAVEGSDEHAAAIAGRSDDELADAIEQAVKANQDMLWWVIDNIESCACDHLVD